MPIERVIKTEIPFPHKVIEHKVPQYWCFIAGSAMVPDVEGKSYNYLGPRLIVVNHDSLTIRARGEYPQEYVGEQLNTDWYFPHFRFYPTFPELLFSYTFRYVSPDELKIK